LKNGLVPRNLSNGLRFRRRTIIGIPLVSSPESELKTEENAPRAGLAALVVSLTAAVTFWSYWPTLVQMADKWWRDPQYSHGFLVPVFALVVLGSRRSERAQVSFQPSWQGVPILLAAAGLHLIGGYYYLKWLDGLSLLPCLAGLVWLLGGRDAWRWAWPAVAFLVFMLPLPFRVEVGLAQPLQGLATVASTYALQTLGLPALSEGNIILIEDHQIGVSAACSGLGMLVTFFALATAFSFVIERPWLDKLVLIISAVPIALVANVVRITLTAVLYQSVGSRAAKAVFHDLAGWFMMPIALALLVLELKLLKHLLLPPESMAMGPVPLAVMERVRS
jgi:exosortase